MILNVSGRCDIVAFFTTWFMKRLEEGFVDVRNPFYPKLVNRIYFKDVDLILFCTKNPIPMVDEIDKIKIPILFHVTITSYQKEIEENVDDKKKIIEAVKKISKKIGKDNIYIRYDPIFLSDKYTVEYHIRAFQKLCGLLDGYTKHMIISFMDDYKNVRKNRKFIKARDIKEEDYQKIGESFSEIAKSHGITCQTCCEEHNLVEYGFIKKDCIDFNLAYKLTGKTNLKKWKSRACHCVSMVDIGSYNSCYHLCKYCYANYSEEEVQKNIKNHDVSSSLLIGKITEDDIIKVRTE